MPIENYACFIRYNKPVLMPKNTIALLTGELMYCTIEFYNKVRQSIHMGQSTGIKEIHLIKSKCQ